jgi:parvulin-like peptidyl-prolyl isomerase
MRSLILAITIASTVLSISACKKNEQVIANVGKEKITEAILNEKLSTMPTEYKKFAKTTLGRKQFIDAIIKEYIVKEVAKEEGYDKKSDYKNNVNAFKKEQQKQYDDYKNNLLLETYIKDLYETIKPTDEDIQIYYEQNKSSYENPVEYTVKHILLSDLQTAQSAFKRIKNGESFEKVTKEVSKDTGSSNNGGLIGPFKKGELVPEFENIVLNLKNNELSDIVETPYGYHIILKVSEQKLPSIPFDKAKETIKRTLEKEKFDSWFENRKQKLGITVNYDVKSPTK